MTMKNNTPMLTEEAVQSDAALVARIKAAKPGKPMTAQEFMAWLSSRR